MKSFKECFDFDRINRELTNVYDFNKIRRENKNIDIFEFRDGLDTDHENSVPISELIKHINELYIPFMADLSKLKKLDIAEELDVLDYSECENFKFLDLFLYGHIYDEEFKGKLELWLVENDDIFSAKTVSSNDHFVNGPKIVGYSDDLFKQYLDLFSKHKELVYTYLVLNHGPYYGGRALYNNLGTELSFHVDRDWSLYSGLNDVSIYFNNYDSFVEIKFKLGEDFGIDYDNCKACIEDEYIKLPNEAYDEFINEIYINKDYIARKEYPACNREDFQRGRAKE